MKVSNIRNIPFMGNNIANTQIELKKTQHPEIKELSSVTPDFAIKTPNSYKLISVDTLSNGLKVYSYKLGNGYKVTVVPMEGSPAVVKNYVNVGSMNETPEIKGISHFLEHMAFNGTNGLDGHIKLNVGDSFKKIEDIGGWTNASTNYAITDYVNSSPLLEVSDLEKQIKILASMTEDLKLAPEMIEKEKGPVSSEINMILDNPQTIAFDQTARTLFGIKNPADDLVGGSVRHVKNLTHEDIKKYYDTYYTPDNMNLVVTGDVNPDEVINLVAKNFTSKKVSLGKKYEEQIKPIQNSVRKDFVSDKAVSTEVVLGFAGPKNNDIKSKIAYDIASIYLTSYSTNLRTALKKYNAFPYVGSEKISTNPNSNRLVYLATSCTEENSERVLKEIYDAINTAPSPSEEKVMEIKRAILKSRENMLQYSYDVNDSIGRSVLNNNLEHFINYDKFLQEISAEDVNNALKQYFNLNKAAITVVHPQQDSQISFKANGRKPINEKNITEMKLSNNIHLGFYESNYNNLNLKLDYVAQKPYNKKAGVIELLNMIYRMGFSNLDEEKLVEFEQKNNIRMRVSLSPYSLKVSANSDSNSRDLILDNIKNLINEPRLTEENLEIAKKRIKDTINRFEKNAGYIYAENYSELNPYEYSNKEIAENIDSVTLEDLKECHEYFIKNSRVVASANLPKQQKEVIADEVKTSLEKLHNVLPNNVKTLQIYNDPSETKVLVYENKNSQADILQVFKFKRDNTLKSKATGAIMNSILSNSSIGLFNVLREKEQLAYSVHSSIDGIGDEGELMLNILTTTDNKEIGEFSYDNLQKSINGFNKQINALLSGDFTEKDLNNAKLQLKSSLLDNEGAQAKLEAVRSGLNSKFGVSYYNQLYSEIDSITKEDVIAFAKNVFNQKSTYAIAASSDTIKNNEEYLKKLGNVSYSA